MNNDDKNAVSSGSYVLNAMTEPERAAFETQLAASEELRNETTELADTAVLLGMAVDLAMPSPALKQNILARLDQLPQLDREEPPAPVVISGETNAKARARWYNRPTLVFAAAAAAVVLIVSGVVGTNIAVQGAHMSEQADGLAAITTASDVQRSEAPVATGGTITLVWSLQLKKSAVIGKGLKALPADKTYELWYMDPSGKPTPAGLFESDGKNMLQMLSGHMSKGDTVGITVEPSGGSKTPTTKPLVAIASA